MSKISNLIHLAYKNAYNINMKKQYSTPALYDAGGDLQKRWYVYYTFRSPVSGKLERQPSLDAGINQHRNKEDRYHAAKILIQVVSDILENGYNPYTDESAYAQDQIRQLSVPEAVEFVLRLKKSQYTTGYKSFESHLRKFQRWLLDHGFQGRLITAVNKITVANYLNEVLTATSAANRNNARSNLSVFFQALEDNEIIAQNFVKRINVVRTRPERNRSYTPEQEQQIYDFLAAQAPLLLTYIMFVSYNFVRPIEVNRLRIGDVDQRHRRLYYKAKNKPVKIKIIPEILARELPDLGVYPREAFLFGMTGFGQVWSASEVSRRDFYTKKYLRLVKKHFKLGADHTIYSFRHTFIAKLYQAFVAQGLSADQAEDKLMLITGHSSKTALRAYLREVDAVLPEDYSAYLEHNQNKNE